MKINAPITKLFTTIACWLVTTLFHFSAIADESVRADEVKVPVGQQSLQNRDIERPGSGMSKTQVEQRYGAPEQAADAVGDPPISSWEYADYIVYFEYDRVIHSVLK